MSSCGGCEAVFYNRKTGEVIPKFSCPLNGKAADKTNRIYGPLWIAFFRNYFEIGFTLARHFQNQAKNCEESYVETTLCPHNKEHIIMRSCTIR